MNPVPKRIAIWGPPGSGKTTFSRKLGQQLKINVIHSDTIFQGQSIHDSNIKQKTKAILQQSTWIIDGNFGELRIEVLKSAELVIILNLPFKTLWTRILARFLSVYTPLNLISTASFQKLLYRNRLELVKAEIINALHSTINFKRQWIYYLIGLAHTYLKNRQLIILKNKKDIDEFLTKFTKILLN